MQNHNHGIVWYTWIIDFIHEHVTSSASKIPVALLIVVNCLLYMASFQMRFCRSASRRVKVIAIHHVTVVPRSTTIISFKSNVFTEYLWSFRQEIRSRIRWLIFFSIFFRLSLSLTGQLRLPPFFFLFTVCFLFLSYYFSPARREVFSAVRLVCLYTHYIFANLYHASIFFVTLYVSKTDMFFLIISFLPFLFSHIYFFIQLIFRFSPLNSLRTLCAEKKGRDDGPENQTREFRFSRGQRVEFSSGLLSL